MILTKEEKNYLEKIVGRYDEGKIMSIKYNKIFGTLSMLLRENDNEEDCLVIIQNKPDYQFIGMKPDITYTLKELGL